ncbi:hypothetical protein WJX84_001995 [Apatococcus fuscideae]|uniref:Uncharacterized protein n=1 Tax=Apatococcus fuscideae TaxID=2026836 RepID=A0AAW1SN97_9CHLO
MSLSVKEREQEEKDRKEVQAQCTSEAASAGFKAAGTALAAAAVAVVAANQYSPGFRKGLGISGKTALVVSPAFFMFFLQSELQLHDCTRRRRRELTGITKSAETFRGWPASTSGCAEQRSPPGASRESGHLLSVA